ncbi:helix-turn-helix domain-containing protein [Bacillaceae bacterium Marseille-Q3522]|nr:helix-turn-helix domain-containing protein [Bacillaceae bacterium Marseille-Q3522]
MKYKDIAEKYGVSLNTVKSWKKRYGWTREKGAHKTKRVHTKGAPIGNKNALGHGSPKQNQNAVKHGFFSKFLPAETLEIMEQMQERSAADLIWDQIQIQYAAIIRAQQIMFVSSQSDTTKELKREKQSSSDKSNSWEEEYELQFAWDKHATFLNAQSRAMSELRNLIKQFDELAHANDERRLKIEQIRLGIQKTKAEIELINGDEDHNTEEVIQDFLKATSPDKQQLKELFGDENEED